jgi:hypothetical protein
MTQRRPIRPSLTVESTSGFLAIDRELAHRGLDASQVVGAGCCICGFPTFDPKRPVHAEGCPAEPRFLSFQLRSGGYSHPGESDLLKLRRPVAPKGDRGPIVIASSDW